VAPSGQPAVTDLKWRLRSGHSRHTIGGLVVRHRKIQGSLRVLIAITVMSESAMNSVHAADWMLLRSDDDRETYIDMQRIEVDGSSNSVT
jgi:hypothetical protein